MFYIHPQSGGLPEKETLENQYKRIYLLKFGEKSHFLKKKPLIKKV